MLINTNKAVRRTNQQYYVNYILQIFRNKFHDNFERRRSQLTAGDNMGNPAVYGYKFITFFVIYIQL